MASNNSSVPPHHALPARPPPSTYSAPPSKQTSFGAPPRPMMSAGFTPRTVAAHAAPFASSAPSYSPATVSAPYQSTATYESSNTYNNNNNNYAYPAYATGAQNASYPAAAAPAYPAAPSMNRGFTSTFDPEEEARLAEWNSAYNRDDANAKKGGAATASVRADATTPAGSEAAVGADGKRKTVVREGGGKQWEDETLLEWNPLHPRLFIGNLAGEVTDDSLHKAFAKYPSLSKARVVRDKKSTKSRSYGFVSFSDTDDYFRAAKEMNGKYIGSHPVLVKRATSEVKAVTKRDDKHGKHGNQNKNKNNKNAKDNKSGAASTPAVVASPAMFVPRGVQKKGKGGGPRVLG